MTAKFQKFSILAARLLTQARRCHQSFFFQVDFPLLESWQDSSCEESVAAWPVHCIIGGVGFVHVFPPELWGNAKRNPLNTVISQKMELKESESGMTPARDWWMLWETNLDKVKVKAKSGCKIMRISNLSCFYSCYHSIQLLCSVYFCITYGILFFIVVVSFCFCSPWNPSLDQ